MLRCAGTNAHIRTTRSWNGLVLAFEIALEHSTRRSKRRGKGKKRTNVRAPVERGPAGARPQTRANAKLEFGLRAGYRHGESIAGWHPVHDGTEYLARNWDAVATAYQLAFGRLRPYDRSLHAALTTLGLVRFMYEIVREGPKAVARWCHERRSKACGDTRGTLTRTFGRGVTPEALHDASTLSRAMRRAPKPREVITAIQEACDRLTKRKNELSNQDREGLTQFIHRYARPAGAADVPLPTGQATTNSGRLNGGQVRDSLARRCLTDEISHIILSDDKRALRQIGSGGETPLDDGRSAARAELREQLRTGADGRYAHVCSRSLPRIGAEVLIGRVGRSAWRRHPQWVELRVERVNLNHADWGVLELRAANPQARFEKRVAACAAIARIRLRRIMSGGGCQEAKAAAVNALRAVLRACALAVPGARPVDDGAHVDAVRIEGGRITRERAIEQAGTHDAAYPNISRPTFDALMHTSDGTAYAMRRRDDGEGWETQRVPNISSAATLARDAAEIRTQVDPWVQITGVGLNSSQWFPRRWPDLLSSESWHAATYSPAAEARFAASQASAGSVARVDAHANEAGKLRLATCHDGDVVTLSRAMTQHLLRSLRRVRTNRPMLEAEAVDLRWRGHKKVYGYSADLSAATDEISVETARHVLRVALEATRAPAWLADSVDKVVGPLELSIGTHAALSRGRWSEEEKEELLDLKDERDGSMLTTGAFMGLGPSWVVLSLMNDYAATVAGAQVDSFSVCGDDLVAVWPKAICDRYEAVIRRIGLVPNTKKSHRGSGAVFCEMFGTVRPSADGHKLRLRPSLRLGEASGAKALEGEHGVGVVDTLRDFAEGVGHGRIRAHRLVRGLAKRTANKLSVKGRVLPGRLRDGGAGKGRTTMATFASWVTQGSTPLRPRAIESPQTRWIRDAVNAWAEAAPRVPSTTKGAIRLDEARASETARCNAAFASSRRRFHTDKAKQDALQRELVNRAKSVQKVDVWDILRTERARQTFSAKSRARAHRALANNRPGAALAALRQGYAYIATEASDRPLFPVTLRAVNDGRVVTPPLGRGAV